MGGSAVLRRATDPTIGSPTTAGSRPATSSRSTQRGCIELADRAKDLIKSGGEWISSVALENALMGHPAVAEAAVIAVPHPKWDERPLAAVVLKPGEAATTNELLEYLAPQFAQWWLPDAIEFATRSRARRRGSSRSRRCATGTATATRAMTRSVEVSRAA